MLPTNTLRPGGQARAGYSTLRSGGQGVIVHLGLVDKGL